MSNYIQSEPMNIGESCRGFMPAMGPVFFDDSRIIGIQPFTGLLNLPLLSLDLAKFENNKRIMVELCNKFNAVFSPHIKTSMCPKLADSMVKGGAWGVSVADLRQLEIMLNTGIKRIILANQIGGASAAKRLSKLLERHPQSEIFLFIDSADIVKHLQIEWQNNLRLPHLNLLIEVGCGRTGTHSQDEVEKILIALNDTRQARIRLSGVAAYEGGVNRAEYSAVSRNLDELFARILMALISVRAFLGPNLPILLTAGGSTFFDEIITRSQTLEKKVGNFTLALRSGACLFGDHGPIDCRLKAIAKRNLLGCKASKLISEGLSPTLRVWSEVLSVNNDTNIICGFGLRDVSHDQGLPKPIGLWRNDECIYNFSMDDCVIKLNDQHAFIKVAKQKILPGDIIDFGVCHPCTTIDKHKIIYGLDEKMKIAKTLQTYFG
jgi:D-serine dehydratase